MCYITINIAYLIGFVKDFFAGMFLEDPASGNPGEDEAKTRVFAGFPLARE